MKRNRCTHTQHCIILILVCVVSLLCVCINCLFNLSSFLTIWVHLAWYCTSYLLILGWCIRCDSAPCSAVKAAESGTECILSVLISAPLIFAFRGRRNVRCISAPLGSAVHGRRISRITVEVQFCALCSAVKAAESRAQNQRSFAKIIKRHHFTLAYYIYATFISRSFLKSSKYHIFHLEHISREKSSRTHL